MSQKQIFIIVLSIICSVTAQYDRCDYEFKIPSEGSSIAFSYPGKNPSGSSCHAIKIKQLFVERVTLSSSEVPTISKRRQKFERWQRLLWTRVDFATEYRK